MKTCKNSCGVVSYVLNEWFGEREVSGEGSNPRISKIISWARPWFPEDDSKVAWCAIFVSWVLSFLGLVEVKLIRARDFLKVGNPVDVPKLGDLVIFWRGSKHGSKGHVGFFIREKGSYIYVLGGNQDNQVNIKAYAKSRLLGYRRYG